MKHFFAVITLLTVFTAAMPADGRAQGTAPPTASDAPVEIFADKTLEWDRTKKTYTAHGNAIARQGTMQVRSDTLSAHYSGGDGAGGTRSGIGSNIERLVASGRVEISSPPYTGHGERAVYDLATGIATLTGGNLKIETPSESLTARDKIEFNTNQNRLTAIGKATAQRGTDSLSADNLSAFFAPDATGKIDLQRIVADTPLTVKTARETVTGDSGVYDVAAGKATLRGRVRLLQGDNWLEGTRAEVDLKTGISKLFADTPAAPVRPALIVDGVAQPPANPVGDGRVRGVFYPKKKEPEAAQP
ncbi:MAG: LptA/OstA family protein [Alphaproteobacteria bacterium]|nr:LptA/OstA family protein [Alphaproteobacteria bacterium]